MAGPLWRFGRGERAKRRGLPEMSRGLLTPPRAAPFCVRQLEVQVRRNHLGTVRDTSLSRKYLVATAFADQSRTQMPFAEGGQATCLARLARPGSGELSLEHCQQAHQLAVVTVAFAQHRGGQEVEIDRICIATLLTYADPA